MKSSILSEDDPLSQLIAPPQDETPAEREERLGNDDSDSNIHRLLLHTFSFGATRKETFRLDRRGTRP